MERHWNRPALLLIVILALAGFSMGCANAPSEESGSAEPAASSEAAEGSDVATDPVAVAGSIAAQIEASPDRAAEILESHGMTVEEWQTLMYEIASDPEKAEAFAAAKSGS